MECKHCNMKLVSPERDCSHSYLIIVFRVVGLFLVVCKDASDHKNTDTVISTVHSIREY